MSGWYLAPALAVLRAEINARWPNRDKTSDGTIGDTRHQATKSDHNPNARGSVNALDIDVDGVHVPTILAAVQRHPSAHYWIWRRQIADADDGWRPRPYHGSSPHIEHLHVSIRQSRTAEQDRRPWGLLEDDMEPRDVWMGRAADVIPLWGARKTPDNPTAQAGWVLGAVGQWTEETWAAVRELVAQVAGLRTAVDSLAAALQAGTGVDPEAIRAAVDRGVTEALARAARAEADALAGPAADG